MKKYLTLVALSFVLVFFLIFILFTSLLDDSSSEKKQEASIVDKELNSNKKLSNQTIKNEVALITEVTKEAKNLENDLLYLNVILNENIAAIYLEN